MWVGWLDLRSAHPQGPFAPESFVVTGYAVSQSGNKAELTIAYTYAGTAGAPIWPTVAVLREGRVLPGFSVPLAAIESAGSGKLHLLLTYQGIGPQTSNTLRILVLFAPEGLGTVVKEIAFRATWIP
jgi:hypothetical protein